MTSVDNRRIRVIDSHTGGEPTLLVVSGGPDLGKGPLTERLERFRDDPGTLDDLAGNHFGFCDVRLTAHSHEETPAAGFAVRSVPFETDIAAFLGSELEAEIFSPTTLLIEHPNRDQVLAVARSLEGHLTATIDGTEQELHDFADLIAILERKVGRLAFNGFPPGVEVCHSMVHGGPHPSTSDGRSNAVGSIAIFGFTRQVCYQGFSDSPRPKALKDANPLGIWRMVNGENSSRMSVVWPSF